MGSGYSGAGADKNVPASQGIMCRGPLPAGWYTIGEPFNSPDHGPFAMRLTPDPDNQMFGRSGFLFHGDSIEHPGCASEGCMIAGPIIRHAVWTSGVRRLQVVV